MRSMMTCRVSTRPALPRSSSSSANSLGGRSTGVPRTDTSWRSGSTRTPPTCNGVSSASPGSAPTRRRTARARAVLRRVGAEPGEADDTPLQVGGVRVDPERHEVSVRGTPVDLPPKEFALLELLLGNAGRVLTRHVIIDRIWGADYV